MNTYVFITYAISVKLINNKQMFKKNILKILILTINIKQRKSLEYYNKIYYLINKTKNSITE